MKAPDVKSVVVAALLGSVALWLIDKMYNQSQPTDDAKDFTIGALVGAVVQVGIRLLGVS